MPSPNTDAPRSALDAASFRDLLDAFSDARAASAVAEREDDEEWARRSHEREDVLRGRLIVTYDALLAAAAERDALAEEAARLRKAAQRALSFLAVCDGAYPTTAQQALRAALAPVAGEGASDGA